MDLQRCQSSKLKSEVNKILGGMPFLSTSRPRVFNIFHAKQISGGSQAVKVKVYSPSTNKHTPRLAESTGTVHTNNIPGGVLFNYLQIFLFRDWESLLPPLSCKDEWINTHHENNPLNMKDTDRPPSLHERSRHTKQMFIWMFRGGTCKFTWNGSEIPYIGRYGGLLWKKLGSRIWMHK
jgi:hypothetical protein